MASLISGILDEINDRWGETFKAAKQDYPEPRIVPFRGTIDGSRCGTVRSEMGPIYCSSNQSIYLDTGYFAEIETRLHGCFGTACRAAAAYIIARQVGHHVQNLLEILPKATQAQQQAGSRAESNALQAKLELQADCLAGVWFNREEKRRPGFVGAGDINAVLTVASALGDDVIQQTAGPVMPASSTYGSAAQRRQWFATGYQAGTFQACNTFGPE